SLRSKPRTLHDALPILLANDVGAEVAIVAQAVALVTEPLGQVQHDGDRQAMVLPRKLDERLAGLGLHIRGVDDRQAAQAQPLRRDRKSTRLNSSHGSIS